MKLGAALNFAAEGIRVEPAEDRLFVVRVVVIVVRAILVSVSLDPRAKWDVESAEVDEQLRVGAEAWPRRRHGQCEGAPDRLGSGCQGEPRRARPGKSAARPRGVKTDGKKPQQQERGAESEPRSGLRDERGKTWTNPRSRHNHSTISDLSE